ncbi:MAG: DUF2934 domain-containing protein, partial [Candidatus Binataceae bacterium]
KGKQKPARNTARQESPVLDQQDRSPEFKDISDNLAVLASNGSATNGVKHLISREEIARRAYELFDQRGRGHGYDVEDWLRAERELDQRHRSALS